jgi:RimJ/RimL family protein N-acetyltransferase
MTVNDRLSEHASTLTDGRTVLRPMTEGDWPDLLRWNNDPEVLHYTEGDDVSSRTLAEVQAIYRSVSRDAFMFMVEVDGAPVGECWLQRMNLDRILRRYPGRDCRRIDLMIGEKALWGGGIGTAAIRLLTRFGFERERADAIFGCDIADYNPRSRRAFEKNGFVVDAAYPEPPALKARVRFDLVLTRESPNARRGRRSPRARDRRGAMSIPTRAEVASRGRACRSATGC